MSPEASGSGGGDSTGGIVPYKNPAALAAYYFGVFSLLPCLGLPLGLLAVILGIVGLRRRKLAPQVKGSIHAWVGIVVGGFCALVWGLVLAWGIWIFTVSSGQMIK